MWIFLCFWGCFTQYFHISLSVLLLLPGQRFVTWHWSFCAWITAFLLHQHSRHLRPGNRAVIRGLWVKHHCKLIDCCLQSIVKYMCFFYMWRVLKAPQRRSLRRRRSCMTSTSITRMWKLTEAICSRCSDWMQQTRRSTGNWVSRGTHNCSVVI